MKLSIGTTNRFTAKPTSPNFNSINQSLVNGWGDYSLQSIVELIGSGCTFSPTHFKDKRKASSWLGQQLFAIDIDEDWSPKPSEAIGIVQELLGIKPALVYYSFSSTSNNNKYRVVIACDEVITDPTLALSVLRGLTKVFKADRACIDLARLFYGTTPDKIYSSSEDYVSKAELVKFGSQYSASRKVTKRVEHNKQAIDISQLSNFELLLLRALVEEQRFYLTLDNNSRYDRLKLLGVALGSLGFLSWSLAEEIASTLLTETDWLKTTFFDSYDKDSMAIVEKLYHWKTHELN